MPRYFMRDTPLREMERLMMSQPATSREAAECTEVNSITLPKMWSVNTVRIMFASIRAFCVNALVWRSAWRRVF